MGTITSHAEWSVYNEDEPRTNNHVEGWHNKINHLGGKSHPNMYEIVELFKTDQAATEVSLLQLEAGGVVESTRRVFRQKEKFSNNEYIYITVKIEGLFNPRKCHLMQLHSGFIWVQAVAHLLLPPLSQSRILAKHE